jgi:putative transposase
MIQGEFMSKRRKSYSAEFKTKVVLELLREEESAAAIASRYGVTVQTLNQWKKKFLRNASLAFDVGEATKEYRQKIEKLQKENEVLAKTLGKTAIERDWAAGKQNRPRKLTLSGDPGRAWTYQVREVSPAPSSKTHL